MGALIDFVAALEGAIAHAVAPHRFSLLMLAFAIVWGWNFCAPAFDHRARSGRKASQVSAVRGSTSRDRALSRRLALEAAIERGHA